MKDLKQKAIKGLAWSVLDNSGQQLLKFIIGIVLARLLSPQEFGLIAMVTVFTGFASRFSDLGLSAALIQKRDTSQSEFSSVFWLNVLGGSVLTVTFLVAAPFIALFYEEPMLTSLTMFVSATFLLGSLSASQRVQMKRELNFKTPSIVSIGSITISGIVAIAMAYQGFGVWALAVHMVFSSFISLLLLWFLSSWRPQWHFDWSAVKGMMGYSLNLFGTRSLNYWVKNIDTLLVGKFLGTHAVGIYSRAFALMLFPLRNISNVLTQVMFPALSTIQEDKKRVARIYLKMTQTIAIFVFPLMSGLFVTVKPFIFVVLGPQWMDVVPVLQIMCVAGAFQAVGTLNGNLYMSQGRTDTQFKVGLFLKSNSILWIVLGLNWGVIGVAAGVTIASVINAYPSFTFAGRLVGLSFLSVLKALSGITLASLTMAVCVAWVRVLLPVHLPEYVVLLVQVSSGAFTYLLLIALFKVNAFVESKALLREQWERFRAGSKA